MAAVAVAGGGGGAEAEGGKRRAASSPPAAAAAVAVASAAGLTIDGGEAADERIERLIRESPVVMFSRRGCCMSHVMKRLLATVGVHPTAIELEGAEEEKAAASVVGVGLPALFIGGVSVGGLEGLMGLHLRGRLVPRLQEVGALWG